MTGRTLLEQKPEALAVNETNELTGAITASEWHSHHTLTPDLQAPWAKLPQILLDMGMYWERLSYCTHRTPVLPWRTVFLGGLLSCSVNMSKTNRTIYIDPEGAPRYMTAKRAQGLVDSGAAYWSGQYQGKPCIVFRGADVRELKVRTPNVQGERFGTAGVQLVKQ